jgi:hypothetical protein
LETKIEKNGRSLEKLVNAALGSDRLRQSMLHLRMNERIILIRLSEKNRYLPTNNMGRFTLFPIVKIDAGASHPKRI